MANKVCYDGATRQGLSSSPAAANVAAIPLDKEIAVILPENSVYTRYADDLTISSDSISDLMILRERIPVLVEKCGFKVNNKKTRIQSSQFGRRIITGIAVDDKITATKKIRKNLRAAKHNFGKTIRLLSFLNNIKLHKFAGLLAELNRKNILKLKGLNEWCQLKQPTKSCEGKLFKTAVIVRTKEAFKDTP